KVPVVSTTSRKKVLTLHEKVELLDKLKDGKSYPAVGHHYGLNESTVRYIKKNEKEIRSSGASAFCGSAKMVNFVRDRTIVRMESALAFWIQDLRGKKYPIGHEDDLKGTEFIFSIQWRQQKRITTRTINSNRC
uniref:HTH psq-type domain-containing protein n=1 Tax=Oryzias latipes TaxID=8090 RepID=A0A3P9IJE7_ORYLA